MDVTLSNVKASGEGIQSPSIEFAFNAIPEVKSSDSGVSVRYVHDVGKQWYVLRASYGREDRALDYIVADGTYGYVAKRIIYKILNGKRTKVLEHLIPNLLFVYTTEKKVHEYVMETASLSYLSFYYNHFCYIEDKNPPLVIPTSEMENFIRATSNMNEHLMVVESNRCKFKGGERVKVIDGMFKGVEGKVARVQGQQRVIVTISNVGLIATAYVPSAFLQMIE